MNQRHNSTVQMIPIDQITVLNPRQRGKKKFQHIVANIGQLGLKKPITVAMSRNGDHRTKYNLACGQGRLEAYQALGQTEIPAIVIEAPKDELLLMSLVENLARRQHTTVERAKEIGVLKDRGCSLSDIAHRTGLDASYVNGIVKLLNKGEERLLQAVEKQQIPLSVAVTIASSNDKSVQRAMADAYEKKELRGRVAAESTASDRRTQNPRQDPSEWGSRPCEWGSILQKSPEGIRGRDGPSKSGGQEGENLRDQIDVRRVRTQATIPG